MCVPYHNIFWIRLYLFLRHFYFLRPLPKWTMTMAWFADYHFRPDYRVGLMASVSEAIRPPFQNQTSLKDEFIFYISFIK